MRRSRTRWGTATVEKSPVWHRPCVVRTLCGQDPVWSGPCVVINRAPTRHDDAGGNGDVGAKVDVRSGGGAVMGCAEHAE